MERTMAFLDYRKGAICPELSIKNFEELLKLHPFCRTWDSVAGCSEDSLSVFVNTDNTGLQGDRYELNQWIEAGYADPYTKDFEKPAPSIGKAIYSTVNVEYYGNPISLELHRVDTDRDLDVWEYIPLTPPDWKKIRRRVEDALRKTTDNATLFSFAQKLGVKLD